VLIAANDTLTDGQALRSQFKDTGLLLVVGFLNNPGSFQAFCPNYQINLYLPTG